jgi:peptidylprolyl isomerase
MRHLSIAIGASAVLLGCSSAQPKPQAGMPSVSGPEQTVEGVRFVDVKVGEGVAIAANDCVYTHYTGWLANGTRFDTSREPAPGAPISFRIGTGRVIRGWDIGFQGMRVGGRRRLYIPYTLGYGERGSPPVIPARADLVFDIEVNGAIAAGGGTRPCPAWSTVNSR